MAWGWWVVMNGLVLVCGLEAECDCLQCLESVLVAQGHWVCEENAMMARSAVVLEPERTRHCLCGMRHGRSVWVDSDSQRVSQNGLF